MKKKNCLNLKLVVDLVVDLVVACQIFHYQMDDALHQTDKFHFVDQDMVHEYFVNEFLLDLNLDLEYVVGVVPIGHVVVNFDYLDLKH